MAPNDRRFGLVRWSSVTDERLAAPGDGARLLKHGVGGRVVLLVGDEGLFQKIKLGDDEFFISPTEITAVDNARYAVGDKLVFDGDHAVVRDVVWHHGKREPFYLLAVNGKKLSKRYFGAELELRSTHASQ